MTKKKPLEGKAKHDYILEFSRSHKMDRYRLRHKITGETVEVSAQSEMGAAHFVNWREEDCYILNLGKKTILLGPKFYVRPDQNLTKEG